MILFLCALPVTKEEQGVQFSQRALEILLSRFHLGHGFSVMILRKQPFDVRRLGVSSYAQQKELVCQRSCG